jgi:HK97 family phage portal protein
VSFLEAAIEAVYRPRNTSLGWGGGSTYSGKTVTVDKALGLVPVYNAVSQIAGAVAQLPLVVYEQSGDERKRALAHPAWRLLNEEPNPEMAADEVWEMVESHLDLWGNAFLYKVKRPGSEGLTEQLWPISPDRVQVTRDEQQRRVFWIEGKIFREDTILHIRSLSHDGLVGYSPIQLARNALANAMAQEEFQGRFLKGDGKPAVLLRHPSALKEDAAKRLKASWDAIEAGGTAVLEEDIKVEPWTMPLEDAQFIEQMQFSDKRIAQMFTLQPGRLGAKTGDSMQYSTVEAENLQFVTYTLARRLTRIESALKRDRSIFPGPTFYPEFLIDALLRADMKTRYEAFKIGIDGGFLDANQDVRPKENLPKRITSTTPPPPPSGSTE